MAKRGLIVGLIAAGGAALWYARRSEASTFAMGDNAPAVPVTNLPAPPAWLENLRGVFSDPIINNFGGQTVTNTTANLPAGAYVGPLPRFGVASWTPTEAARPYLNTVLKIESKYGIPRGLLARLIQQESAWNPTARNSRSGAYGLAQFMPATAKEYGVTLDGSPWDDIDGAGRYLLWLRNYLGGWAFALAGYNWGPGNVKRKGLWNAPTETRHYLDKISGDIMGINFAQAAALHQDTFA